VLTSNKRSRAADGEKRNVPAFPLMIMPELAEPANVPVPVTAPLIVIVYPIIFIVPCKLIFPTVTALFNVGLPPAGMVTLAARGGIQLQFQLAALFQLLSALPVQV
jgi:uncharacterized membrane protein